MLYKDLQEHYKDNEEKCLIASELDAIESNKIMCFGKEDADLLY